MYLGLVLEWLGSKRLSNTRFPTAVPAQEPLNQKVVGHLWIDHRGWIQQFQRCVSIILQCTDGNSKICVTMLDSFQSSQVPFRRLRFCLATVSMRIELPADDPVEVPELVHGLSTPALQVKCPLPWTS